MYCPFKTFSSEKLTEIGEGLIFLWSLFQLPYEIWKHLSHSYIKLMDHSLSLFVESYMIWAVHTKMSPNITEWARGVQARSILPTQPSNTTPTTKLCCFLKSCLLKQTHFNNGTLTYQHQMTLPVGFQSTTSLSNQIIVTQKRDSTWFQKMC